MKISDMFPMDDPQKRWEAEKVDILARAKGSYGHASDDPVEQLCSLVSLLSDAQKKYIAAYNDNLRLRRALNAAVDKVFEMDKALEKANFHG